MGLPAEHARDTGHRLLLHGRAGATAVEGMVIRIQEHRHRIRESSHGMRRFEHLSDIERMRIGIVIPHPFRDLHQYLADRASVGRRGAVRKAGESLLQGPEHLAEERDAFVVEGHGAASHSSDVRSSSSPATSTIGRIAVKTPTS